jgi:hypothetical protein
MAASLGSAALGGTVLAIALLGRGPDGEPSVAATRPDTPAASAAGVGAPEESGRPEPAIAGPASGTPEAGVASVDGSGPADAAGPRELPIEEALAATEDPRAVFYMSRIREALREGNPAFAEELLRQMRERHGGSILVDEAAVLVEESRRNPGRWQP